MKNLVKRLIQKKLKISFAESRFGELTEMFDERMRGKDDQWVRPHPGPFVWNKIEKKQGNFSWQEADEYVVYAQEHNQIIIATIWPYANWEQKSCKRKKARSPFGKHFSKYLSKPCSMDNYKTFLLALVDRYDGDGNNDMQGLTKPILYWEIMNEPEFKMFFKGKKDEFIEITRIKEEFIANASHELKTPIASVRLAAESALTSLERDDGMTKTFLEQILRDSDRMNELISDLLDLSAMESSDVFMESFDLHEVIANEVSYLSKQNKKRIGYKKKKVEINANFDDISLAVKNLIKNALKYSPSEKNILIQVEENNQSVRCSFQDFGSGISKSDQEKIFERFYRVDKGRSRKVGGTGLGLAIVKHALDRNNAVIEIVSELDYGSTFTIVFEK